MDGLSETALADLAGTTVAEVQRLVDLGILVRDVAGPFRASDVERVRLVQACERAGLPLDGIAAAIRAGRLSLAFEEVVPLLELAQSMGNLDRAGMSRIGRAWAEGLRLAATVENQEYSARFAPPQGELGTGRWEALEQVARLATELLPLADRAFMACYRRQQELVWTEDLVEVIEGEVEAAGVLVRPERVPAMCFLDLAGYTRLTEERGDQAAAELAGTLAELVGHTAREHGGLPVKWLGDGVMVYFREPAAAVRAALQMVERLPAAGLPPAHVGVAAGPVVAQGGDYFGRTVNLAARIAAHAGPGQVLVSASVAEAGLPAGVALEESGEVRLKGFARPVRLALRSEPSTWPRQIAYGS
jgi:adenylate cyclase